MGPEFEKGDGRLRPSLQQRLPGAEGPPEGCATAPRHAACGGPLPSSAEFRCYFCIRQDALRGKLAPSSGSPPNVPAASPVRRLPAPSPSRRSAPRMHRSSTLQQTTAGKVRQFMGAASKQEAKQGIKARGVAARTPPLPAARYPHLRRTASARSGPTSTGTTTSTTSTAATPRRAPPALHHHPFPRGSPP